jgi:hypothetical protein
MRNASVDEIDGKLHMEDGSDLVAPGAALPREEAVQ